MEGMTKKSMVCYAVSVWVFVVLLAMYTNSLEKAHKLSVQEKVIEVEKVIVDDCRTYDPRNEFKWNRGDHGV